MPDLTVNQRRCDSKKLYGSEGFAIKVAKQVMERSGEWVIAYQCFNCGGWHIGHPDSTQRKVHGNVR